MARVVALGPDEGAASDVLVLAATPGDAESMAGGPASRGPPSGLPASTPPPHAGIQSGATTDAMRVATRRRRSIGVLKGELTFVV